jgi:hypothetical protein
MAIKFLINGYFRSGTTFLFNLVKEQLPDHQCFYEPCYPKLGLVVENHKRAKQKTDKLHNASLWNEYAELSASDFHAILRNHPNTSNKGISSDASLFQYLDIYNNLQSPSVLQTNRYHLYLGAIQSHYSIPVVHVIRNPIDIYFSLVKSYTKRSSGMKNTVRKLIFPFTSKNYFGQESELKHNIEKLGLPSVFYDNWKFRYFKKISFQEKVYINWVLDNYAVLTSKQDILIAFYENLTTQTEMEAKRISAHIQAEIRIQNAKPTVSIKSNSETNFFLSVIEKYKLNHCLEVIQVEMNAQNINYFQP